MSAQAVAEILGRALRERAFAERLLSDADATLAAFDLTEAERSAIVDSLRGTNASGTLEDRPYKASRLL